MPPRPRVPSAGAAGTCSSAASSARSTTAPTSGSNRPRSTTIPSSSTRRLNPRRARHICAPSSPAAAASRSTPRQPRTSRSTCSAVAPHATASSRASVNGRAALMWLRSASAAVTRSFSRAAPRSRPVRQLSQWAPSGSLPSRAGGRTPASHTAARRWRPGCGRRVRRCGCRTGSRSGGDGGAGGGAVRDAGCSMAIWYTRFWTEPYAAVAGLVRRLWTFRGPHIGVEAASAHVRLLVRAILAWIGAGPKWAAKAVSNLFWGALRVGVCCGNYQSRTLGRGIGVSVRKRSHRPARHFVTPALQSVLQTRSCPSDSLNTRPTPFQ